LRVELYLSNVDQWKCINQEELHTILYADDLAVMLERIGVKKKKKGKTDAHVGR